MATTHICFTTNKPKHPFCPKDRPKPKLLAPAPPVACYCGGDHCAGFCQIKKVNP
jgi:hypothetical protein